jgi:chorismate-pyruvate lyase
MCECVEQSFLDVVQVALATVRDVALYPDLQPFIFTKSKVAFRYLAETLDDDLPKFLALGSNEALP